MIWQVDKSAAKNIGAPGFINRGIRAPKQCRIVHMWSKISEQYVLRLNYTFCKWAEPILTGKENWMFPNTCNGHCNINKQCSGVAMISDSSMKVTGVCKLHLSSNMCSKKINSLLVLHLCVFGRILSTDCFSYFRDKFKLLWSGCCEASTFVGIFLVHLIAITLCLPYNNTCVIS